MTATEIDRDTMFVTVDPREYMTIVANVGHDYRRIGCGNRFTEFTDRLSGRRMVIVAGYGV